jgi:hypothetical protein
MRGDPYLLCAIFKRSGNRHRQVTVLDRSIRGAIGG